MIVVAIVLVLTGYGIGLSRDLIPRHRTERAARQFSSLIQRCRYIAIQSNRECSVWLVAYDSSLSDMSANSGAYWVGMGDASTNSTTWDLLPVDSESDGTDNDTSVGLVDLGDDGGNNYARHVGIQQWTGLAGPGVGNSDRIVIGPRGFVTNPAGDFGVDGFITLTFVNKAARFQGKTEDYVVQVSRSGMTRIYPSVNEIFGGTSAGTPQTSS